MSYKRNQYPLNPEFWQSKRNIEIARMYNVCESSVSRKRANLIKKYGKEYECRVLGWYGWDKVDWNKTDTEILSNWDGNKKPKLKTIQDWREKKK